MKDKSLIVGIALLVLVSAPLVGVCKTPTAGDAKALTLHLLYEAAKKEGELVIHDGGTIAQFQPLINAFSKRFPGIKVKPIMLSSPLIAERIIAEANAGKLSIDVADGNVSEFLMQLIDRGLLRKLDLSDIVDVPRENIVLGGYLFADSSRVTCIAYNTDLVSKADVPKTWEDLLNPKWKGGKIFLARFGLAPASLFFEWEKSKALNYLKMLRNQDLVITPNPRASVDAVSSGQAYLGEAFTANVQGRIEKGAPIALTPISPQLFVPNGCYALEGAPHPNAARLFISWLQMPEGRKANLKFVGEAPESRPENCPSAKLLYDSGIKYILLNTPEQAHLRGQYQAIVVEALGILVKK
jgi:iron(III) transport system substrate-binding protein